MSITYSRLLTVLLALMPALALPTRIGSSVVFYLSLLASLLALGSRNVDFPAWRGQIRQYAPLTVALLLPLATLMLTFLARDMTHASSVEKSLRFALALPIFWVLLQVRQEVLRHIQWGLLLGALGGAGMILFVMVWLGHDRGALSHYGVEHNAVSFANIVMLFGLSSLLTLGWQLTRFRRLEAGLKILAALLCFYAVIVSGTRSSWLVIPFFVPIMLSGHIRFPVRKIVLGLLLTVVAMALMMWLVPVLNARVMIGVEDIRHFLDGTNYDTSLGIRLQLWYAALYTFWQYPWFGIGGTTEFAQMLHVMAAQNLVSPIVAAEFGEPHNDYLSALACFGIGGFISLLLAYYVPAWYFWKRLKSHDANLRVAAALGLLLCASFGVFSLTEQMFRGMRMVPVYTVLMVAFMALSHPRALAGAPQGAGAA